MSSATAAYRKDLLANGRPFGERDGELIAIASLAEKAKFVHSTEMSAAFLADAAIETERAFGHEKLTRFAVREWNDTWSGVDSLVLCALVMHESGARLLSALLLDSVLATWRGARDLRFGRALAVRARMAFHSAEHEVADDLYGQVGAIGRRIKSAELRGRAEFGFAGLAQVRGNHPAMLAASERFLAYSEESANPHQRMHAHYVMMMSTAVFGRFDEAVQHGWQMHTIAQGDPWREGFALSNLGHLFIEMGDRATARSAFSAVLRCELPAYQLVAVLGSLALTVAPGPEANATLNWTIAEVRRVQPLVPLWASASALLDCVAGLRSIGRIAEARALRDEIVVLAEAQRFHELAHRAESMRLDAPVDAPADSSMHSSIGDVATRVRRLERRLPRHVRAAAAGV